MQTGAVRPPTEDAESRKARGAFFTPDAITSFIARWAIRNQDDLVFEPSVGDAAFLIQAISRLKGLSSDARLNPEVFGAEIHASSAASARERIVEAGGVPRIATGDFFEIAPDPRFSAVIGNPPYVRYQTFTGASRERALFAASAAGVKLSSLASSWAAFVIHASQFLRPGGRLGLVLPAELLSVNYAAPVRSFLFSNFGTVNLVLFAEQVFPEVEANVVLLLADNFREGAAEFATIHNAVNADSLAHMPGPFQWKPNNPAAKWTGLLADAGALGALNSLAATGGFTELETWGDTTLGMVTGNNKFFALSPARVRALKLNRRDLVRVSPPGSAHLRRLALTDGSLRALGKQGRSTWLFYPSDNPGQAALDYIQAGEDAGVHTAYKCRIRNPWYKVPLMPAADLLLTAMNSDTARLTTNLAGVRHLNSVYGVYFKPGHRDLGRELMPIASLNSATMLSAEIVGRSYGGGILKLEPREADIWSVPSPHTVQKASARLRELHPLVHKLLLASKMNEASALIDQALLVDTLGVSESAVASLRYAYTELSSGRATRGRSGR